MRRRTFQIATVGGAAVAGLAVVALLLAVREPARSPDPPGAPPAPVEPARAAPRPAPGFTRDLHDTAPALRTTPRQQMELGLAMPFELDQGNETPGIESGPVLRSVAWHTRFSGDTPTALAQTAAPPPPPAPAVPSASRPPPPPEPPADRDTATAEPPTGSPRDVAARTDEDIIPDIESIRPRNFRGEVAESLRARFTSTALFRAPKIAREAIWVFRGAEYRWVVCVHIDGTAPQRPGATYEVVYLSGRLAGVVADETNRCREVPVEDFPELTQGG